MKRGKAKVIFGIGALLLILLLALFGPLLVVADSSAMNLSRRFESPSAEHWFGLDQNGVDLFRNVSLGARLSLIVAFSVVGFSAGTGLLIGSWAGYRGGWADMLLMRFIDLIHAFPGFILALSLVALLGPSTANLILAMCLTGWTGYARLVRAEILHLKTREYVIGATACGASDFRVLIHHIWPNLFGILVVQMTFGMAGTVIAESGLSFLGLGAPPDVPTWGALLNAGRRALFEAPHLSLIPGGAIFTLVLAFNFLGDGLRSILNPTRT